MLKPLLFLFIVFPLSSNCLAQNVGVGTATPLEKLHVNGNIKADTIKLSSIQLAKDAGQGKLLTSDANGNASWRTNSNSPVGNIGFGVWGDCAVNGNIGDYQPVAPATGKLNEAFGWSSGMSGNWTIVGAPQETIGSNTYQGAAYIYFFNGTQWVQTQRLTASDGGFNDLFGSSVSIWGNYAFVGAPLHQATQPQQGVVYVFRFNGTTWDQHQVLTSTSPTGSERFGWSVSANNAGVIIGAPSARPNGSATGAAFIFYLNNTTWTFLTTVAASDGASGDDFGEKVCIASNFDAIVGAPGDDVNGISNYGSAYVYSLSGTVWEQKITVAGGASDDRFGSAVSISSGAVLIGAPRFDVGSVIDQGAAFIFAHDGNSWIFRQKLGGVVGTFGELFGSSVHATDQFLFVGAPFRRKDNSTQGGISVFQNVSGIWRFLQNITDPAGSSGDDLGHHCSADGRRFVFGVPGAANFRGIAIFGKIN